MTSQSPVQPSPRVIPGSGTRDAGSGFHCPMTTPDGASLAALGEAMFEVWLHGNWLFLTEKMATPAKEAAAAAVERHWTRMYADDGETTSEETRAALRWWTNA